MRRSRGSAVGVEMFLLEDGEILLNEVAPRPHNERPLHHRGLRHEPVRAAPPGGHGLAAGLPGPHSQLLVLASNCFASTAAQ